LEDSGFSGESNARHHEVNVSLVHSFLSQFLLTPVVDEGFTPLERSSTRVYKINVEASHSAADNADSSAHLSSTDNRQVFDLVGERSCGLKHFKHFVYYY
jgi:hypothetical protein